MMRIVPELTDAAVSRILGGRVERYRIEAGLTQAELAERAGIGKRTLERVEAGRGAELATLIRVLRALNALEGLDRLLPELPPSPIEQLRLRGKQRRRVSRARRRSDAAGPLNETTQGTAQKRWTWNVPADSSASPERDPRSADRKT